MTDDAIQCVADEVAKILHPPSPTFSTGVKK